MTEPGSFGDKLLAAFGWAGKHGRKARLHGVVDDAIKRHGVGDGAQQAIMDAINDDPALMVEMLDELKFRRPLVERFMQKRIAALRSAGATIKMPPKGGAGTGQTWRDTHAAIARPAKHDSSGQYAGAAQMAPAAAKGDGGQHDDDAQVAIATTPTPQNGGTAAKDGARHNTSDVHGGLARPSTQQPASPQHRAAMLAARNKTAQSVLTRASMVSGKPYGDLTKGDLQDEVRRADHRGQFARRVLAETAFPDEQTPLKRVLDERSAAQLWDKAWEAVTHAA